MDPDKAAPPPPLPTPATTSLEGIGGWLIALLVLQSFYLLVDGLGLLQAGWFFVVGKRGVPLWPLRMMLGGQIVLHGACFAVAIFATFLLVQRRTRFVKVFTIQLVLFAFVPIGELILFWLIMYMADGRAAINAPTFSKVVIYLVIAVGLRVYLESSVRVRNTFVR